MFTSKVREKALPHIPGLAATQTSLVLTTNINDLCIIHVSVYFLEFLLSGKQWSKKEVFMFNIPVGYSIVDFMFNIPVVYGIVDLVCVDLAWSNAGNWEKMMKRVKLIWSRNIFLYIYKPKQLWGIQSILMKSIERGANSFFLYLKECQQ